MRRRGRPPKLPMAYMYNYADVDTGWGTVGS
jgi:hypothetical protein